MNRLRWKLSKVWKRSYDDPYWLTLHPNQWRVYAEHYRLDLEEKVESQRQLAEYIMSFHNVEAVRAVQRARDLHRRNQDQEVGNIFAEQVASLFGRELSFDEISKARHENGVDKPSYIPENDELKDQMEEVRKKAIPKEDTLVVRKPNKQPSDTHIEVESQRFRQIPRTPKEDK